MSMISMAKWWLLSNSKELCIPCSWCKGVAVIQLVLGTNDCWICWKLIFETKDPVEAFKVGMACGAATAFTKDIAVKSQIDAVYHKLSRRSKIKI